jgi:AcrR family transcriptional regulator
MEASTRRRPSTQAQRRAETRAALLDATIECLVTHGYARTTTGRIAELAGVSRGAQLPYFRSRADIVSAAVGHLAQKRVADMAERFGDGQIGLEECLDALWEVHQGPVFEAALELWVASRTEPELRANLVVMEREVAAAIASTAQAALGTTSAEDLVFALSTIRGLALLGTSNGQRAAARAWPQVRARLLRALA